MIDELDLYTHPDATADIKNALKVLNEQIKIVEGLEHAKARLESTSSLDSNTLSKCNVFVRHVNNCTAGSSFDSEVRKLNLAELAFCSISFEERRLKSVAGHFAASNIQAYITTSRVSCLDRPEVFARLKRLSVESTGQRFHEIYTAKQAAHDCSWQSAGTSSNELLNDTSPSPKPATTAKQLGAFEFPTARWRNIDNVFPKQTADAIHRAPQRFVDSDITDCVRSSFPRDQSDGDAIIWMDLDHLAMLSLLRDTRRGIRTSMVRDIFGDAIANAMEESDLRKWEKRNGSIETTACVRAKVFCHIELRIGCDSAIAKKLFN